jgi:hypothetical protein
MGCPSLAGLRVHLGETSAGRWIRDADKNVATGTFDLAAGELWFAFQRLVAVRAIEFEFFWVHKFLPIHAQTDREKYMQDFFILLAGRLRM